MYDRSFFGWLSSRETISFLARYLPGTCLIRISNTAPSCLVISVALTGQIAHYRVQIRCYNPPMFCNGDLHFGSIDGLLDIYKPDGIPLKPLDRFQVLNLDPTALRQMPESHQIWGGERPQNLVYRGYYY
jgi:hypothetical protein